MLTFDRRREDRFRTEGTLFRLCRLFGNLVGRLFGRKFHRFGKRDENRFLTPGTARLFPGMLRSHIHDPAAGTGYLDFPSGHELIVLHSSPEKGVDLAK